MNRKVLAALLILILPALLFAAVSCGGQSQLAAQEPSPLTKATQTVTEFLELCKQGQHDEATQEYLPQIYHPPEDTDETSTRRSTPYPQPPVLDDVSSYFIFS